MKVRNLNNSPPMLLFMTTTIWNVRGAGRRALHRHMQQLLQKFKPSMVILLETKVDRATNNRTFKLLSKSLPTNVTVPSNGHGSGLWICWDPGHIDADLISQSSQHITLSRNFTGDRCSRGFFTAIYASPNWQVCRSLWESLLQFRHNQCNLETPWLLLGDFNCVLGPHEKKGRTPVDIALAVRDFQQFISEANLQDMGFVGTPFTWSNQHSGPARILERLDRGLASPG